MLHLRHLRRFEDRNDISDLLERKRINKEIFNYITEEIKFGNSKPFEIEHELYKSGDYICSSFKIDNRDVIVSSIVIPDKNCILLEGGRHYNYLSDYILQFGIKSNKYLFIGFGEYINGEFYYGKNINDSTLFRKMTTIIEIIKTMIEYHNINYIIFNLIENDLDSGLIADYNKRDKFYELYLSYMKIKYHRIKTKVEIDVENATNSPQPYGASFSILFFSVTISGETISNFYLLDYKNK